MLLIPGTLTIHSLPLSFILFRPTEVGRYMWFDIAL